MQVHLTVKSSNIKTGPIPVSTTSADSCPDVCPLKSGGCYAKHGPLGLVWRKAPKMSLAEFAAAIAKLPEGQLWRHNQAGDLPGADNRLDVEAVKLLVSANKGRRGFTYTHYPVSDPRNAEVIRHANANGFTVNLSGNNLRHADSLAESGAGPVVTVLPAEQMRNTVTPGGRRVVVCPAVTRQGVSCATCQLCAKANRKVIVGFPAHGTAKRKASAIAAE